MPAPTDRPRALAIAGPTASGKTALALALRERAPVEIISVDSAQVYVGMDIGTAKPDAATLARAPHRLIDIRDPAIPYSAAEFVVDARREMAAITAADRIPLLVGGTMLYFHLLIEGMAKLPAANPELRAELAAAAARHGWPHLHAELARVDPETAAQLHPRHSQRIQRALEVYRATGQPLSRLLGAQREGQGIAPIAADYNLTMVALLPPSRDLLHQRIAQRFETMLAAGLVAEVRALYERGDLNPDLPSIRAAGYRQVWAHLAGECDAATMAAQGIAATRQLAKRQLTWLRGPRSPAREGLTGAWDTPDDQRTIIAKLLKLI
ncbi:MAG: tRNA (adenosine(37)-N6)-dimethylallyltransferase MiaA [Gammaproteobacteria bacterium]|nr:tRNA (adenosine(37)-N6)-dimethylallyltransferase MiaA [Gammaproteobacteria bacterium]